MRACAMRMAATPDCSSPMNVREAPVTPCTIEILPARRFESWARNSVGRRSLIRPALQKNAPGARPLPHLREDLAVGRVIALAAARGDDQMHAALERRIALGAGGI